MVLLIITMFLFPLLYLFVGYFMKRHHSKFPDTISGYHVGRIAEKSEKAWEEANTFSGNLLILASLALLLVSAAVTAVCLFAILPSSRSGVFFTYIIFVGIAPFIFMLTVTERHLRKLFDENGDPKP